MVPTLVESLLAQIPAVGRLLLEPAAERLTESYGQARVAKALRTVTEQMREHILRFGGEGCGQQHFTAEWVIAEARRVLAQQDKPSVRRAINGTGIILHTGLGRAVLAPSVIEAIRQQLCGYATLAIDRQTGQRKERDFHIEWLLTELTGCEAATLVNNNAAATLLTLTALAAAKEVIVSRGQLIEIGGGFRIPEVMAQSGARLVEVGTTNRTRLSDYREAIGENTAIIMRVHPSNYRVVGFTADVPLADLAALAHERRLILVDDIGSGALHDMRRWDLPEEPTVLASLKAGADLVLFSADKLLCGPQGGLVVGRRELVERLRKHPLSRALRPGKLAILALERTLQLHLRPELVDQTIPAYRMLTRPLDHLRKDAETLATRIREAASGVEAGWRDDVSYMGSGSLPVCEVPTAVIWLRSKRWRASGLSKKLRLHDPPVIPRVEHAEVILDLRTIDPADYDVVVGAVSSVACPTCPVGGSDSQEQEGQGRR